MADEPKAWDSVKAAATGALSYWVAKLDVRSGVNDKPLKDDVNGMKAFTCLLRAISWVESKHGTDTSMKKNKPSIDPMQCGNPRRPTWKSICGRLKGDRIKFSAKQAVWLSKMDAFVKDDTDFPDDARMAHLKKSADGRNDAKYNQTMSYYWSVLLLIHKVNKHNGGAYKAGVVAIDTLVDQAAKNYNAEDYAVYVAALEDALQLSGCSTPLRPNDIGVS